MYVQYEVRSWPPRPKTFITPPKFYRCYMLSNSFVLGGKGVQTFFLSYKISFITINFYGEHEKDLGGATDFWVYPSTLQVRKWFTSEIRF